MTTCMKYVCCKQVLAGANASDGHLASSLAQANQSVLQLKQKTDQLSQQLAVERSQKAELVSAAIESLLSLLL